MRTVILCEGTTDLIMLQFLLQYKYGWRYKGFIENTESNRLVVRKLERENGDSIELKSCGGISNIPEKLSELKDSNENATKAEEVIQRIIVMFDHDTVKSPEEFLASMNDKIGTDFKDDIFGKYVDWNMQDAFEDMISVKLLLLFVPAGETGAIETVMLNALNTDKIEEDLIISSEKFIDFVIKQQDRYLQKKSRWKKAIFNTYFVIRAPEEKYDERAKILSAYDWKGNEVLEKSFGFLDL